MKEEPIIVNPPKKRRKRRLGKNFGLVVFVLIFLGLVVAVPYYFLVPKEETYKLQQYEFSEVTTRDFVITIPAQGKIIASRKVAVTAPASGDVVKVYYQAGDLVKEGDLLVELKSEKLQEDYATAESQFQKKVTEQANLKLEHEQKMKELEQQISDREGLLEKAQKDLPIWEQLYELGDISLIQLQNEQKKIEDATRALAESRELKEYQLRRYQINLQDTEAVIAESKDTMQKIKQAMQENLVRAPISGKIIALAAKVGGTLQMGGTLAEIIDETSLLIEGEVALSDIEDVTLDQPVAIQVGGQGFHGKVSVISPVAKESKVAIQVEFEQIPEKLRAEATVSLEIQTGVLKDQLALPRGRYLSSGQERFVYVVKDGHAEKREVTFGLINGNYIQVRVGLKKGERVITTSYDNYSHIDEIEVNPEGGYRI